VRQRRTKQQVAALAPVLAELWTRQPRLTLEEIAERMDLSRAAVSHNIRRMRGAGLDLPMRARGRADGVPCCSGEPPAPQPVTEARMDGGMLTLTRFDSVADWRARKPGSVTTTQAPRLKRPAHYGTFRETLEDGMQSPWLSVRPTLADGAPMNWRRMLHEVPVTMGGGGV
jgi:biotin operon repressor